MIMIIVIFVGQNLAKRVTIFTKDIAHWINLIGFVRTAFLTLRIYFIGKSNNITTKYYDTLCNTDSDKIAEII